MHIFTTDRSIYENVIVTAQTSHSVYEIWNHRSNKKSFRYASIQENNKQTNKAFWSFLTEIRS